MPPNSWAKILQLLMKKIQVRQMNPESLDEFPDYIS
jgi:CCR4-NOT transcriptional regulation complex NOT5 subunit